MIHVIEISPQRRRPSLHRTRYEARLRDRRDAQCRRRLELHREICLYYQTTSDFSMEPDAAWEDLKVGVEHLTRWERIAVVTDVNWLRRAVRAFSFLLPGRIKVFLSSDTAAARQWITNSPANYTSSAA